MTKSTIGHARWTADLLDVQPEDEVLEIGFGNGANIKLLQQLARRGSVTGAEVSATALEMASKKCRGNHRGKGEAVPGAG